MALNHRLTIVGSDIHDNNLDIKVYMEGYEGAPAEREGTGESLSIEWGAQQNKLFPLIYGSAANVKFYAENDYEFLDLFANTAKDVFIEILINTNTIIWAGFIEPEKWSEQLISPTYEVSLTAYDGLGLLKDEDFLTETKEFYEGLFTPLQIARLILSKTGLALPLNTAVNVRPAEQDTAADALTQYRIDLAVYRGKSCYEVLEQLFLNTRIFQRNGQWWIISNGNFFKENITCHHYTNAGAAAGTVTFNTRLNSVIYEDIAKLEIIPAIKQLTFSQDYGFKNNLVLNPNFEKTDNENISDWDIVGTVAPEQKTYDADGNTYIYLPGREHQKYWDTPRSNGIRSAPIKVVETTNKPMLTVSFAVVGMDTWADNLFIGVQLIADDETKYSLIPNLIWDNKTLLYTWQQRATVHPLPVPVKITHKKHFFKKDSYFPDPDFTPAHPIEEVINHFNTQSLVIYSGIPKAGKIYIYLYLPNSNYSNIKGSCWRNVGLKFLDQLEEELPTGSTRILMNTYGNNYTPADLEFVNGSIPYNTDPPATMAYRGGFLLPDDSPANVWKLEGHSLEVDYAEMMARLLAEQLRHPKQSVKARLMDAAPGLQMAFVDPGNPGHTFLESGITYDFIMNSIEGTFIEIKTPYAYGFTFAETQTETKPDGSTKTVQSTNPAHVDNDERVKMITPLFEVVNQAGYLSTDHFEQEIDELTGRAIITPISVLKDGFIIFPIVTWLYDYTFHVSHSQYVIMGRMYWSNGATITLDPSDPTFARIDVFAVNAEDLTIAITGIPAPLPLKPTIDPAHQLEITFIIIEPGTTQPANITDEIIYDENIEWTGSVYGTLAANFDNKIQVLTGIKSLAVSNIATNNTITFTADELKTFEDYEILSLFIFLKAYTRKTHGILVQFLLSSSPVSDEVNLPFDRNGADSWQNMAINLSAFNFTDAQFNAVRFRWVHNGPFVFSGFYLDLIRLQKVVSQIQPPTASHPPVTIAENSTHLLNITNEQKLSIPGSFDEDEFYGIKNRTWQKIISGGGTGNDGRGIVSILLTNTVGLVKTYTITYTDATTSTFTVVDGEDGSTPVKGVDYDDGAPGRGIASIVLHATAGLTKTYRITYTDATTFDFDVKDGKDGEGGSDNFVELALDFYGATSFVYNVPCAMKFTSIEAENAAATVDPAINTTLARFDKVTITAASEGLVILQGETL